MDYTFKLTVKEVLQSPHFKQAEIVAGKEGLDRVVDWVHIVEIAKISHLLNGNELILSTGVGWGGQIDNCLSFLQQLIERNSAGLCIELGTYFSKVPDAMIQLADEHRFPIIVFPHEVRFIDITQDLHSVLHEAEKQRQEEDRWIRNWVQGNLHEQQIRHRLQQANFTDQPAGIVACLGELTEPSDDSPLDSHFTQLQSVSRSVFTQQGFSLLSTYDRNRLIYILLDQKVRKNWKTRLKKGMERVKKSMQAVSKHSPYIQFGIGKMTNELNHLHTSFQTAQEALAIQQKLGKRTDVFYDDLHIYRIITYLNEAGKLHEFVMEYLEPIIQYDRTRQGNMMQTLKTFLACNGSKQETAARLFIVRQTLYHRLEKLEDLLGPDFMHPEKRLAIELAILAYEYLQSSQAR